MSIDRWMKIWYVYRMGYYSAIKRNETESDEVTWMNLEPGIPNEGSQKDSVILKLKL